MWEEPAKHFPCRGGGENKEVTEWQIILEVIEEEELLFFFNVSVFVVLVRLW